MGNSYEGDSAFMEAHKVYVAETAQHLQEAAALLSEDRVLTDEEQYRTMARFHTIKGGAGFFGFKEIAKIAGTLEELFKGAPEAVFSQRQTVKNLLEQLIQLTTSD